MSCCGKKIKGIASVAGGVIKGNARFLVDRFFITPDEWCDDTKKRLIICRKCDMATWLTLAEFYNWCKSVGVSNVIKNIDDLTVLPDLPTGKIRSRTNLMCKKCKCFIPAKARVADEKCPLGKW